MTRSVRVKRRGLEVIPFSVLALWWNSGRSLLARAAYAVAGRRDAIHRRSATYLSCTGEHGRRALINARRARTRVETALRVLRKFVQFRRCQYRRAQPGHRVQWQCCLRPELEPPCKCFRACGRQSEKIGHPSNLLRFRYFCRPLLHLHFRTKVDQHSIHFDHAPVPVVNS